MSALKPHPMCDQMHARGYCICVTVECMFCEVSHPPSKMCRARALAILSAKDALNPKQHEALK